MVQLHGRGRWSKNHIEVAPEGDNIFIPFKFFTAGSTFNRGSYCGTYPIMKGTNIGMSHAGLLHVCTFSTASC